MASVKSVFSELCKTGRVERGKEGTLPGLQKEILKGKKQNDTGNNNGNIQELFFIHKQTGGG